MDKASKYKISVIIPAYNSEKYLRTAVKSVLSQTYKELEIIIINDGSTDGTEKICKELKKEDNRINYFYKDNGGAASARNFGLRRATGDYVHFLDADDKVHAKTYETIVEVLKKCDLKICYFGHTMKEQKLSNKGRLHILTYDKYIKFFLGDKRSCDVRQIESASMFLADRKILQTEQFLEGHTLEDVYFNFKILKHFNRIGVLTAPMYFYNQENEVSVSTKKSVEKIHDIMFVWETIFRENDNPKITKSLQKCLVKAAVITLYFIYKNKYQENMLETISKCKGIIKTRNKLWMFQKNLKTKHKLFLFAFIFFDDKIGKIIH